MAHWKLGCVDYLMVGKVFWLSGNPNHYFLVLGKTAFNELLVDDI